MRTYQELQMTLPRRGKHMTEKKTPTKSKTTWSMALLQAQRAIGSVSKDSTNEYQKFDYTSAEHMVEEAKVVLNNNGLIVYEKEQETKVEESGLILVNTVFVVEHPESGESREMKRDLPSCPGKGRPEDKAVLGSGTTLLSYFLRGLLLIPRVDEEVCARDDSKSNPATTRENRKGSRKKEVRGIYSTEVMKLAETLASHSGWPGSHTFTDALLLGEERTSKTDNESMIDFLTSSIDRLNGKG